MTAEKEKVAGEFWTQVQLALGAHGFSPGVVDGIRGPNTDGAIAKFKASVGYRNTPYLGPLTQLKLWKVPDEQQLHDRKTLVWPHWLETAYRYLGLKEIPGARDNPQIVAWWDEIGAGWFDDDETPWCGAFVGGTLLEAGIDILPGAKAPRARAWEEWGQPLDGPAVGAVVTFWRGSRRSRSGHVAFVLGQRNGRLVCLGGNQTNAVTVANFSPDRATAYRWPMLEPAPVHVGFNALVKVLNDGHISINEA